jgi:hypothetical protein
MGQLPPGRTLPLAHGRRFIADVAHFSRGVPFIAVERRIRVPEVAAARQAATPRPGWLPVFLKAFGLAARQVPDLRRSWLSFPWPRLYEHPVTVAGVTVARDWAGEPTVFILPVRKPEERPLADVAAQVARATTDPVRDVPAFRRLLLVGRLPVPVRRLVWWLGLRVSGDWRQKYFGTVTVNNTANAGADVAFAVTPMTSYFTFGRVGDDGGVTLRLVFDHRVYDATPAGRGLEAVEAALTGPILDELRAMGGGCHDRADR